MSFSWNRFCLCALALASGVFASGQVAQGEDDILNRLDGLRYAPDAVVVAYQPFVSQGLRDRIVAPLSLSKDPNVNSPYFVRYLLPNGGKGQDVIATIRLLRTHPFIRFAEPDIAIEPDQSFPNDPRFNEMWGLHNTGQSGGVVDADIDAPEAWQAAPNNPTVVIAMCDDGFDYNHPDLAANTWVNEDEIAGNGIDDDANGFIDDVRGWDFASNDNAPLPGGSHGTHVGGTVAAVRNNGVGVSGVVPNVRLMPIRHYSGQASWMTALVSGIDYAWQNGAKVITVSYNIDGYTQALVEAIQRAGAADVVYCNSAGNNNQNNPPRQAIRDVANNVIFVASSTRSDTRSSFSNYGTKIEIAAPGSDILSTLPNNSYGLNSGTSMATPHLAGIVGYVRAMFPNLTARQALDRVIMTADFLPAWQGVINGGRANLNAALENDTTPPAAVQKLTILRRSATSFRARFEASGDDGMNGSASKYEVRVSPNPISEANFASARALSVPINAVAAGTPIETNIVDLSPELPVYVAIRALDNLNNPSAVQVIGPISPRPTLWFDPVNGPGAFTAQGGSPWATTNALSFTGLTSWTDSPGGNYANNANWSLTSAPILVPGNAALKFFAQIDLELNLDFLIVETSIDGGNSWQERTRLTGTAAWQSHTIPILGLVNQQMQVRFRLLTNASNVRDGVYIDDVHLVGVIAPFQDNVEGASQWTAQAPWATTTTRAFSPTRSWTDSPGGNYASNANTSLTQAGNLDISGLGAVRLSYMLDQAIEPNDSLFIEVSPNSGASWTQIARLTDNASWRLVSHSLAAFSSVQARFRFNSNASTVRDGVYLDDITIFGEPWQDIRLVGGTVNLDAFVGNPSSRNFVIELRTPGTQTVLESLVTQLMPTGTSGQGRFLIASTIAPGTYDVAIKGQHWLRRVIQNVDTSTGLADLTTTVTNGDFNRDNRVSKPDLAGVQKLIGTTPASPNWNPNADLDGNGAVTQADYRIAVERNGQSGNP